MEDYDLSMLYLPPKKWNGRAEEWHDQVDNLVNHVREQIAQEIEDLCKCLTIGIPGCEHMKYAAIARGKK